jgi:transposase
MNGQAEQAIRPAVVNRKVWGGNCTWAGARAQRVLPSVLETCQRAGCSGLKFVSQTLRAFGNPLLPWPVLLPPRYTSTATYAFRWTVVRGKRPGGHEARRRHSLTRLVGVVKPPRPA